MHCVGGVTSLFGDVGSVGARRLRARLLVGAALLASCAAPAMAQSSLITTSKSDQAMSEAEGLTPNSFYMEADSVTDDDKNKTVTAEGHVEVRSRGRTLRAQTLTYQTQSGVVTAKGDVVVINPDGTAEFAKEVVLDDDLRAGVALGFSARLQRNVKIAAASAIRRSQDVNELSRAIYTPCDICTKDGAPKKPTWSIQADRVVQDAQHHVIYYQNAVIRILGIPVFYAPVFWNPDGNVRARSGFLSPQVDISHKRGLSVEQPYELVISPSQDLVISPIINTSVNPFLNLRWRKRFNSGVIDARIGYTYEDEFDNSGEPLPGSKTSSRSYILASGVFHPSSSWTWGFAAERASDDLLFDRYDIQGVYDRRGLYETDSRRLLSQLYLIHQDQNSYVSIAALDFQGLRIGDVNGAMPIVAPLIEARWQPDTQILGGRLRVAGSAVVLERNRDATDPNLPGLDSRRATSEVEWRGAYTVGPGLRVEPFGSGRFDLYSISDDVGNPGTHNVGRTLGALGVNVSWPLIKPMDGATIILEPLAEGIISPRAKASPDIPNEDSAEFVFDETNLFDPNRTPGFDVYDSGVRLNFGGRGTIDWGDGRQARVFFGRSLRTAQERTLPLRSGYTDRSSDWVFAASATPMRGLTIYSRTQLDGADFRLRRQEAGANIILPFLQGYVRYLHDYTDPSGEREDVELAGDLFITKHWGIVLYGDRDLQRGLWQRRDIGLLYQDECAKIELVYHHEAAFQRLGGPSNSVQIRLTLATLGEQGYRDQDRR